MMLLIIWNKTNPSFTKFCKKSKHSEGLHSYKKVEKTPKYGLTTCLTHNRSFWDDKTIAVTVTSTNTHVIFLSHSNNLI